jgi:acyl-coenzyme A synthetase/AMP-(fatty) acid ligase
MIKHAGDNVLHSSIEQVVCGGEMLPPVVSKQFRDRFGLRIKNAYGMSELGALCIAQSMDDYVDGMIGRPFPGVECKVLDNHGNQVALGEVGELYVKSQHTASFYWKDWQYTNHTFVGDWLRTGDRVKIWPNQNLEYVSRADDQIKINGQFVSSIEIESKILEFPGITDCAVVFKTAENTLPDIHAFIVDENQCVNYEAIKNFLSNTMPTFKIPRYFHMVESIPKTLTNKKTRYVLKEKL